MKISNKIYLYIASLVLGLGLRVLQLNSLIENSTGFYKRDYKEIGGVITLVILVVAIIPAIIPFKKNQLPKTPPIKSYLLSFFSFATAVAALLHILLEAHPVFLAGWQVVLLKLSGIATVIFFLLLGINYIKELSFVKVLTVIPIIYFIARIICDFTAISSLALTSDSILLLAAYCSTLWFLLNFAKLYNGLSAKPYSVGLVSSALCIIQSASHIIYGMISGESSLHISVTENLFLLVSGIFTLAFVLVSFFKIVQKTN